MLLYLIRHGQTDWNRDRRIMGRSDIPLNERGREMVRETARWLAAAWEEPGTEVVVVHRGGSLVTRYGLVLVPGIANVLVGEMIGLPKSFPFIEWVD